MYGSLMSRLVDVINPPGNRTASTDGRSIHWDSGFCEKSTDQELRFVLLHETLHCAHLHFDRMDPKDENCQKACDYVINGILSKSGMDIKPPAGALLNAKYGEMAEEIVLGELRRLPKQPPQKGNQGASKQGGQPSAMSGDGQGNDPGQCGGFHKPDDKGKPESKQQLAQEWKQAVVQAAQLGRGTVPQSIGRIAEGVTKSQDIDWSQETVEFLRNAISDRNDWSRSARRHATSPCIVPRKTRSRCGLIVVARDTSGSIGASQIADFNACIAATMAETGAEIILIDCDSEIADEQRLSPGSELPATAKGGGGTDFRPVFTRANELTEAGEVISGIVYLTDMDGTFPESSDIPTLWVSTRETNGPFGRTVKIN